MSLIIEAVLRIVAAEVGVHEEGGNNYGPEVKEYLASVRLPQGNPWCAALVAWVMRKAGLTKFPMTGDTWALRTWAMDHGAYTHTPARGMIFLLLDHNNDPMHTGIVTQVNRDRTVSTIEGNTGLTSDTDGDGVARKRRRIDECMFVDWAKVLDTAPPVKPKLFVKSSGGYTLVVGQTLAPGNYHLELQA